MKNLILVATLVALGGCANNSANMRVGTDMTYASLKDQREANQAIQVTDRMPPGAVTVGNVDASRCHRNTMQAAPTDAEIITDLKVAAYARGADGITAVDITSSSGLMLNCWKIINGKAQAFQVKK